MVQYAYSKVARDSLEDDHCELQPLSLDVTEELESAGNSDSNIGDQKATSYLFNDSNPFTWQQDSINFRKALVLAVTIINLAVCFRLLVTRVTEQRLDPRTLRMPNQFYGLDQVLGENAPWMGDASVITFPTLLQQIDRAAPNRVYPDDPRRHRSTFGVLSPEDRPLYISSSVSTIAQFKLRDYRMRKCVLRIVLPSDRSFPPSNETISENRQRDWVPFEGRMSIYVRRLAPPEKGNPWIDPRTLSFRNRPRSMISDIFTTLIVQGGEEASSPEFACAQDEVVSFELSCDHCVLDVWQDKQTPPIGLIIEQLWV